MPDFDESRYAGLLAEVRPVVIESEQEHDRLLTAAESLMEKGDRLAPEERRLLELLVLLIESFEASIDEEEDEEEPAGAQAPPQPHETLGRLLEARELAIEDIADIFGNPHLAGEALAGRRPITRGQAKQLSQYFRVPVKLFQS